MLRTFTKHILLPLLCIAFSMLAATAATQNVTATGAADGDAAHARTVAFTEAMREAVRQGAGVDIASGSSEKNRPTETEKILSTAFDYISNYTVKRSALDPDGIYRVTIDAEVRLQAAANQQDSKALEHIVRSRGAPRVAIDITELHQGLSGTASFAAETLGELARQSQMNTVNLAFANRQHQRLAATDALNGKQSEQIRREARLGLEADVIIVGEVRSRYLGRKNVDNLYTVNRYSVSAELSAVRADTGQVIAQISLPAREDVFSRIENPENAVRDVVGKYLAAESADAASAQTLIDRIISHWLIENDLGKMHRIEITGIDSDALNSLEGKLRIANNISGVWLRQYDAAGFTVLDVETRLPGSSLTALISSLSGGGCKLTAASGSFFQFSYSQPPPQASSSQQQSVAGGKASVLTPVAAALLAGGAVIIAIALFTARKKHKG